MGYTHYFTQLRNFTTKEWEQVRQDVSSILDNAQQRWEIPLGNREGERGTSPDFTPPPNATIAFNGWGDDGHETFFIEQKRSPAGHKWQTLGASFCKTARKPYDTAVTAVLCYLSSFHLMGEIDELRAPVLHVSSDGTGADFLKGLELARQALPRFDNVLDIPIGVMERDRWCPPWVRDDYQKQFEVNFCLDGFAYVEQRKPRRWFRFHSHEVAARYLMRFREKEIWFRDWADRLTVEGGGPLFNATGSFDVKRRRALGRQQIVVLRRLFDFPADHSDLGTLADPPAYVRPGQMVETQRPYSLVELLKEAEKHEQH